ncbi:amino acid ABC transporter permease [Aminobacter sp. BE322]|uniref:amino acid ABC transporter permease n=1 Tax=unclassified Aminobacter TaxID=2644704 RepID=UPI003D204AD6
MNYDWNWGVFWEPTITGEGRYIDWLLSGLGWTIAISLSSWIIALSIGTVLGVIRTLPGRSVRMATGAYVELFRNIPLLVQLFLWYYVVPQLLPLDWQFWLNGLDPRVMQVGSVVLCLGLFTSARVCEQVRAGIEAQPGGQKSAALALGLTLRQAYQYALLPMAFRIIIPPLTSEFLNVFKNSAVALTIGLLELTGQTRQISEFSAQIFETFLAATSIYFLVTYLVSVAMRLLERSMRVPGFVGGARS